jgi:hypothetical protein
MKVNDRTKSGKVRAATSAESRQEPARIREKIITALNNPSYRYRTLTGISQEANLNPAVVLCAITNDKTLAKAVKIFPMRARDGRTLLTTKERFSEEATLNEKFVDFFATKRPELSNAK